MERRPLPLDADRTVTPVEPRDGTQPRPQPDDPQAPPGLPPFPDLSTKALVTEPPSLDPSPPTTAIDPNAELRSILAASLLHALRSIEPRAYFERMARTEPNLFYKYVALLAPQPKTLSAQSNVVNILAALPRSPLDELPKGFRLT